MIDKADDARLHIDRLTVWAQRGHGPFGKVRLTPGTLDHRARH
jgi:hypothetical protein